MQTLIVDMLVQLDAFGKLLVHDCSNFTFHIEACDLLIISQAKKFSSHT